jgi:hypothetical protein
MLAVTRSDYMLSRAPAGGPVVAGIKQIEFNSLSIGGLPWTSKVASKHSYLSNRYPHAIDDFSPVQSHPSHALSEVAQAIGAALNSYCLKHGIEPKHACVLHIQGHSKYAHNVTDQEVCTLPMKQRSRHCHELMRMCKILYCAGGRSGGCDKYACKLGEKDVRRSSV